MVVTSSRLLPIDGFRYETWFGFYVASVVRPPHETLYPTDLQRVEIEFTSETCDTCPVRRLSLYLTNDDLVNDLAAVIRLITNWVLQEPNVENYFEYECHFRGELVVSGCS